MRINNKSVEERRKYQRIDTTVPIEIKTEGFDIVTSTKNLSCSGAYCQANSCLAPMTKLDIALDLNNQGKNTRVRCKGVVVRAEPALISANEQKYNIAIFFNDISDTEKQKIDAYIKNIPRAQASGWVR